MLQKIIHIATPGRGFVNITERVGAYVQEAKIQTGLCHLFIHHTSASLVIAENSDPQVRKDLEQFMQKITPDGDPIYEHVEEGPDDMPSHTRTILTETSMTIPITRGQLALGTWQGIFVWEHRLIPHQRQITITLLT